MNLLTIILWLLLVYLFMESGYTFFALLALAAGAIALLGELASSAAANVPKPAHHHSHEDHHRGDRKTSEGWSTDGEPHGIGESLGAFLNFWGKLIGRVFETTKEKKDHGGAIKIELVDKKDKH